MSLTELISGVEAHRKTLTVFNADPGTVEALRERFAERNVTVTAASAPGAPREYVVLGQGESFLTAADVDDLLPEAGESSVGFETDRGEPILDALDRTTFTAYEPSKLLAASREIEDRAWRVGRGAIHAGFQTLDILEGQLDVYERLAALDELDVHLYAAAEGAVPDHGDDLTVHVERADEIRSTWFVAYDGAGVPENKCALVADEHTPREFAGFWTYDPATVDYVVDHLGEQYPLIPSDT
jgi:hypothetical protein